MRQHLIIACVLAGWSLAGHAAVRYRFESSSIAGLTINTRGTVVMDGSRSRIDYDVHPDEVVPHDVEISDGTRRLGVDTNRKSWYEIKPPLHGDMYAMSGGKLRKVSKIKINLEKQTENAPTSSLARYTLRFSYKILGEIQGTKVKASVKGVAEFLTDSSRLVQRIPLDPREIRTSSTEVDQAIAQKMRIVSGFPLEMKLVTTRQFDGGAPFEDTRHMKIFDIQEVEVRPTLFEIPKDYENREPEIGVPGRSL